MADRVKVLGGHIATIVEGRRYPETPYREMAARRRARDNGVPALSIATTRAPRNHRPQFSRTGGRTGGRKKEGILQPPPDALNVTWKVVVTCFHVEADRTELIRRVRGLARQWPLFRGLYSKLLQALLDCSESRVKLWHVESGALKSGEKGAVAYLKVDVPELGKEFVLPDHFFAELR